MCRLSKVDIILFERLMHPLTDERLHEKYERRPSFREHYEEVTSKIRLFNNACHFLLEFLCSFSRAL